MQSEELRQRIIERLGTFPILFVPALSTPEVLEELWDTFCSSYLDISLPSRLKEKIALRISLYGSVPFALFWHCCELKKSGIPSADILRLLESPIDIPEALDVLRRHPRDVPEFSSTLENAIAIATDGVLLRLPEIDQIQQEIRRILGSERYNRWAALVACMEMLHRWADTHPEIGLEMDPVVRHRSLEALSDEPQLIDFLSRWQVQMERNRYLEERLGQAEADAPTERAVRKRFRTISQMAAILAGLASLVLTIERFLSINAFFFTLIYDLKAAIGMTSILMSGSLWIWNRRPLTRLARLLARAIAVTVCVIILLIFIPGAASPLTCLSYFLLGLALLTTERTFYGKSPWCERFAIYAGILAYFSLLANAFGMNRLLAGTERFLLMSPAAASISVVLAIGILAAHPSGRLLAMVGGATRAGQLVRRALLLFILFPVVLGWVGSLGEWAGWYSHELALPIIIVGNLLLLGGVALAMGRSALRSEHQQEQVETLLHHREQDFRGTFDQAAVGIAHIGLDGRYIRVNDRLCEIFGCSREKLLGSTGQELIHPDDQAKILTLTRQLMTGEIPEFNVETRFLCCNQRVIWGSISAALLHGSKGERRYAVVIIEEITERKMAEEEAARQKANAEAASQAKDNLLSVISHELRTPLTPVLAALSGLKPDTEKESELLGMIRRNIEHEICLIDDLLELTRLTHGKMRLSIKPLDLHPLIEEVVTSLRSTFEEKGIRLQLLLGAARHVVNGDPSRLRQILMNLLDNARKFTPVGGQTIVKTSSDEHQIVVRVTDSGPGISKENLARIFEAFEQADPSIQRSHGGLGLGLTITKGLVEAHGGTIGVESLGPGRGSSFFFKLSTIDAEPAKPAPAEPSPLLSSKRILLVEDHDDTRTTLQHLLQRRGHEVCAVAGISDAINAARRMPFDVLISDIRLPDGNGLTLPETIGSTLGHFIPAIALSGFGAGDDERQSREAGFLLHLTKPIDFHDLEAAILQASGMASEKARK